MKTLPQSLNIETTEIFFNLVKEVNLTNDNEIFSEYYYWPECSKGVMAVHVEKIASLETSPKFPQYSISYCYLDGSKYLVERKVNFIVMEGKRVYPVKWSLPSLDIIIESMIVDDKQGISVNQNNYRDVVVFVNEWFQTLAIQQSIKPSVKQSISLLPTHA